MNAYIAILKYRLLSMYQYRAATITKLFLQFFWGIIRIMIFSAFFRQATTQQPITLSQTITFIWLGQALLQLLPWFRDKELETRIQNGNVAYDLLHPIDLYWLWFSRSVAIHSVPTLIQFIPLVIIAWLFLGLSAPVSLLSCIFFCLSLVCAALLSSAITSCEIITLFWTFSGEGIQRLLPAIVLLLSGMLVPLPLFPEWLQPFLNLQPFRGITDIPCRIYTGIIPLNQVLYYLLFQIIWTLIFIITGKLLMKRALKQFVIQGG
jgi:ABC-2 type transport system permease protein